MSVDKSQKILLLGGTGAMGVYLIPELLRLGYQVSVTSRSDQHSNERRLLYIKGDAKDDKFLKDVLSEEKYDAVIDFMVYHTDEFKSRIDLLVKNTEHYIFLSSYRVFSDSKGQALTEASSRLLDTVKNKKYLSTDEYGLTKARQENILNSVKKRNWTIVRPAITYSTDRFQLGTMEASEFLYRALKGKTVIFPKEMLDKKTTMSWAGDVAKMIARLTLNKKSYGETYIVATAENHSWRDVINAYKNILDMKIKIVSLKEYIDTIGRPYQVKYDRMYDRVIDNHKVLSAVNMKQSDLMSLKNGLRMELSAFSRKKKSLGVDVLKQKKMDKITATNVQKLKKSIAPRMRIRQIKALTMGRIKYDGAIVSLGGYYNYGGLIQRLALQTFLKKHGYKFKVFNFKYMLKMGKKVGDRKNLEKFAARYIDEEMFSPRTAKFYKTYIVGSDQVWRDWFGNWNRFKDFFLGFVTSTKAKKIAYAASFGVDDLAKAGITDKNKKKITSLIKKFDAISVREESAENLVAELQGKATTNLDPTLLLTKKDYSKLIDASKVKDTETAPVFYYLLDSTKLKLSVVDKISSITGMEAKGILPNNGKKLPKMEKWLKSFRDSEIVVTDSFHGIVFSVINKTPFIAFGNEMRGLARMIDFLKPLGLEGRVVIESKIDKLDVDRKLQETIDWTKVYKLLDAKRKDSSDWLLESLKNPK